MDQTAEIVWGRCLEYIRANIPAQAFKTWFAPIKPVKIQGKAMTIQVPSEFFYEWLEEHYIQLLRTVLIKELGPGAKLLYSVVLENKYDNPKSPKVKMPSTAKAPASAPVQKGGRIAARTVQPVSKPEPGTSSPQHAHVQGAAASRNKISARNIVPASAPKAVANERGQGMVRNPFVIPGLQQVRVESQLNPNYTFDDFIEGESNRLARSAGFAVANKPGGTAFNPLMIYGGVGLGKTHLAHAIGVEIKSRYPDKTVLYVSSEKFIQQFIDSIRNDSKNDFINFYQMIDVLIIDDVQFFSGKKGSQDVFFHIFNHLHQTGKQLVLTADKAPAEMQDMEERLLSRFKWGLSAEIKTPDFDTRVKILRHKLYKDGIDMPEEVINYMARTINTNVRELEGALISLLAQSSLNNKELTVELAEEVVGQFIKTAKREISIDYIKKVICDYFEIDMDVLQSKTRKRNIVQARQLAMYFAKNMTKQSLASIGAQIGKRDHATVLHACKTVENLKSTDKKFQGYFTELNARINAPSA